MISQKAYFGISKWREFTLLAPSYYVWTSTGLFVLIYIFDLVKYVEQNNLSLISDSSYLLVLWGLPAALTVSFTGMYIDYNPTHLKNIIYVSLLLSPISLLLNMISLLIKNSILMIVSLFFLGFFTGIAIISSQAFYGIFANWRARGKVYSIVMFAFGVSTLLAILVSSSFFVSLIIISVIGIILCIVFYIFTKDMDISWKSEEGTTKLISILSRPSVNAYF
jgi:MFS family permease